MTILKRLFGVLASSPNPASRQNLEEQEGEALAKRLEQFPSYRVLRALNVNAGSDSLAPLRSGERIAVVVDSETTGLDPVEDRLIEIAAQRFTFDETGQINSIESVRSWLEDPGRTLPDKIVELTGLTDSQLAGRRFDEAELLAHLESADLIIAHNAAFDRPFFDSRFPELRGRRWACSLSQLDWSALGFEGRALGHLVMQSGWFFEGHRAGADVNALTVLLSNIAPDGRTVFSHLLEACNGETVRIEAIGAPFEVKESLKQRGYRWDGNGRFWWRELNSEAASEEFEWLDGHVYFGRGGPRTSTITARERFTLQSH